MSRLTTFYFHLMFTTLNLNIINSKKLSANITGLKIFEPKNFKIQQMFQKINITNTKDSTFEYDQVFLSTNWKFLKFILMKSIVMNEAYTDVEINP